MVLKIYSSWHWVFLGADIMKIKKNKTLASWSETDIQKNYYTRTTGGLMESLWCIGDLRGGGSRRRDARVHRGTISSSFHRHMIHTPNYHVLANSEKGERQTIFLHLQKDIAISTRKLVTSRKKM